MADNVGNQIIGWKFRTPLKAEYLNKFMSGDVTPGLITRPPDTGTTISGGESGQPMSGTLTIQPFMVAVNINEEKGTNAIDYNDDWIRNSIVKINFTNAVSVTVQENHVAIGIEYTFQSSGSGSGQNVENYAEVKGYTLEELKANNPVIIYTLWQGKISGNSYIFATTAGATLSSMLLYREGWCYGYYVDIYSPYQAALDAYPNDGVTADVAWTTYKNCINRLVLRSIRNSNNNYQGYCSGSGISSRKLINPIKSNNTYFDTGLLKADANKKLLLNEIGLWNFTKASDTNLTKYQLVCLVRDNSDNPKLTVKGWDDTAYPVKESSELPIAVIELDGSENSNRNNFPLYNSVIKPVIPGPRASSLVNETAILYLN